MSFSDSGMPSGKPAERSAHPTSSPAFPGSSTRVGPSPKNLRDELNAIITVLEPGGFGVPDKRDVTFRAGTSPAEKDGTHDSPGGILAPFGPIAIKDNIFVAGATCTAGCAELIDFYPTREATAITCLRNQGAVLACKTNMHELALGITSANIAFGAVKSALDSTRCAGGSSGGTGAVIGAGWCTIGLGSDTGGSGRIPAAWNGIWGFRPSTGRYPGDGMIGLSHRDTIAPMAHDMNGIRALDVALRDLASILSPAGSVPETTAPARHVRIGVARTTLATVSPEVADAVESFVQLLGSAGATGGIELVDVDINALLDDASAIEAHLRPLELVPVLNRTLRTGGASCDAAGLAQRADDPLVRQLVAESVTLHGDASLVTREREWVGTALARLTTRHRELYEQQQLDAIMMPVTPTLPPLVSEVLEERDDLGKQARRAAESLRMTLLATLVAGPSLAVPLPSDPGAGVLLDALPGTDDALLRLGTRVESLLAV